jgi:hypothetical protein
MKCVLPVGVLLVLLGGCGTAWTLPDTLDLDLPSPTDFQVQTIPSDGRTYATTDELITLGEHTAGTQLRISVESECVHAFFILDSAGDILDGGTPAALIEFGMMDSDRYFMYLDPGLEASCSADVTLTVRQAAAPIHSEPQAFVLDFGGADGVQLSGDEQIGSLLPMDLGTLVDLTDLPEWLLGDEADSSDDIDPSKAQTFLHEVQPVVEELILERLVALFESYSIQVVADPAELDEATSFSTIYFTSSVGPPYCDPFDTLLIVSEQESDCAIGDRILYGTAGRLTDIGNRIRDDDAVVYVGSFGGENLEVLSTDVASLANALAAAAAHEMGHLLGLQHTFHSSDVMWGRPSNAAIREIGFVRCQAVIGEFIVPYVYQNPDRYLRRITGS